MAAKVTSRFGPAASRIQAGVALFVLAIGAFVYILARPADSVPFFSAINVSHLLPDLLGRLGGSLPTFAHAFAFSLLTAICLGAGERNAFIACFGWFGIDTAFEVGQHPYLSETLATLIPTWFERVPVLRHTEGYFVSGRFDFWDLISIAIGAATAYVFIWCTPSKDAGHE